MPRGVLSNLQLRARFECIRTLKNHISICVEQCSGELLELVIPIAGLPVEGLLHAETPALREFLARLLVWHIKVRRLECIQCILRFSVLK